MRWMSNSALRYLLTKPANGCAVGKKFSVANATWQLVLPLQKKLARGTRSFATFTHVAYVDKIWGTVELVLFIGDPCNFLHLTLGLVSEEV